MRTKLLLIVCLVAALASAPKSVWTQLDKAFYLNERDVNFVRPGLVLKILDAQIDTDGAIRARFRITDPMGLPLEDRKSTRLNSSHIQKSRMPSSA